MTNILILDCELAVQDLIEDLLLREDDPDDAPAFDPSPSIVEAAAPDAAAAIDPLLDPAVIGEAEMIALWGSLDFLDCPACAQAVVTPCGTDLL